MAPSSRTRGDLRDQNLSAIVRQVHAHGQLSRPQLGGLTGLTRSSVADLVKELAAAGLLLEGSVVAGNRGRPAHVVMPSAAGPLVTAVVVEVDSISVGLAALGGQIERRLNVQIDASRLKPEQVARQVSELMGTIAGSLGQRRLLPWLGVSVAGVVRRSDGHVEIAPNLHWRDVPFAEILRDQLPDTQVLVGNDGNLGALAEYQRGAGRGARSLFYLFGERGVGGGLIVDGAPMAGAQGYSGEVGHMPISPDGPRCDCGATGCWQTYVSAPAIVRLATDMDPKHAPATLAQLLGDAERGEPYAIKALAESGRYLGLGLACVSSIMNPDRIVLGGYYQDIYPHALETMQAELDRRVLDPIAKSIRLVRGTLGEDALILGASELAWAEALRTPEILRAGHV